MPGTPVSRMETDRKGGPPIGNLNACRHGLRLQVNTLPKGCCRLEGMRRQLRRLLESEVAVVKGQVCLVDAALIATAVRWETVASLVSRWLRMSVDTMSHADRLSYISQVAKASSERDKCIRALGIDARQTDDMWASLYGSRPTILDASQAAPALPDAQEAVQPSDAPAATPANQEAFRG